MTDTGGNERDDRLRGIGLPAVDLLGQFWSEPLDYTGTPARRSPRRTMVARILAAAICLIIGLLLTTAYRQTAAAEPAVLQARAELRADIDAQREQNAEMEALVSQLRADVLGRRDALLGEADQVAELHAGEAMAGFREVTGDGAVVTIAAGDGSQGRVYDRDLQLVVNTLWAYGAEAVSVDGQRITATTAIRQAGGSILVDFVPVSSPYRIEAIGPSDLADRFDASTVADTLRSLAQHGVSLSTEAQDALRLEAAREPQLGYATVEED
ncbi:DUF881 domain-containing protein [Stackebrandtia soli]|uniref:DUF881 domain-containing protein n=1 Tax=Stackebrandtia soli TaxID=1892856 RepID=UPI0039EBC097